MLSNSAVALMAKLARSISVFVLSLLVFHFATGNLARHRHCECCKADYEVSYGCNCPGCLAERGDLACYCSSQHQTKPDDTKGVVVSLKPIRCTCGAQDPMANSQNPVPFIPQSGPPVSMIAPAGSVEIAEIPLTLEDVIPPRDRPG